MPQRAKSKDEDVINELLARQDDVIGELDKLEAEILEAIQSLNTSPREEQGDAPSAAVTEEANTIKIQRSEKITDDGNDRSSRAA